MNIHIRIVQIKHIFSQWQGCLIGKAFFSSQSAIYFKSTDGLILKSHFSAVKLLWKLITALMFNNEQLLQETCLSQMTGELILELSVCSNIDQLAEHSLSSQWLCYPSAAAIQSQEVTIKAWLARNPPATQTNHLPAPPLTPTTHTRTS